VAFDSVLAGRQGCGLDERQILQVGAVQDKNFGTAGSKLPGVKFIKARGCAEFCTLGKWLFGKWLYRPAKENNSELVEWSLND